MKKNNLFFVLSVVKRKMSVKRKVNTKISKEKCDILLYIEQGMTNKETPNKFGVPKNTISTWIKSKEKKFFKCMKKVLQVLRNNMAIYTKNSTRVCFTKDPEYSYRWVNDPRRRSFLSRKTGDP